MTKFYELMRQARTKAQDAIKAAENGDVEGSNKLRGEAEALRQQGEAIKSAQAIVDDVNAPQLPADLPTDSDPPLVKSGDREVKTAINLIRFKSFGDLDDPTDLVMREVYAGDYRQIIFDQTKSFGGYLRGRSPDRILTRQLWMPDDVKSMLLDGLEVKEIKATMVEGQDILGGYAVPPQMASEVNKRIRGLTVMREGGARVIETASNAIEWLRLTGGDDRYASALRGSWGAETQSPAEKNLTFGLDRIDVHLYTYKVRLAVSLIEDAANIVDIFVEEVSDTLAIDEDNEFLVGTGAKGPRGILPGGGNTRTPALTEVNTGNASLMTMTGLKRLKRGVASHYRRAGRASFILNGDTATAIEEFQDGQGRFYFEDLDEGLLRATVRESEAMVDVAANAYPAIYGDLSGYAIVERLGLAVQRYNDSGTGINIVEFHVRRRIGGDLVQPWKIAVQKVAA
jgi:HK97 family phage major capsid protein